VSCILNNNKSYKDYINLNNPILFLDNLLHILKLSNILFKSHW